MSVYDKLDGLLIIAIREGRSPLYARDVNQEADLLAGSLRREAFRIIDGRLTALKKAGRIKFRTKLQAASRGVRAGWGLA